MAKKKLQITILDIGWYILCAAVCAWGFTYSPWISSQLGDIGILENFDNSIKELFD